MASHVSEAAASLGLLTVVAAWVIDGPSGPVERPVALVAFGVLCVRLLAAALVDLTRTPDATNAPDQLLSQAKYDKGLAQTTAREVAYMPFAGTPLPPATKVPTPVQISVADKLDTTLCVFDFIPMQYHAAIRLNKHIDVGNVDVTKWFQAAIDFVGQNGGPGQSPMSSLVIDIPAGRFYVSNLKLAHGITLRGQAIQSTMLCPVPGTTGSWLKNYTTGPPSGRGNAGKISIERMRLGGGGEKGITVGIDLEGGDGGWGDYSDLRDIQLSGLPNATGIRLQTNVSVMYNVWTEQTHHGILNIDESPGSSCLFAFGCGAMAFTGVGITLQNGDYWCGVEIEAPLDGSTPVEIYGSATINGIMIGLPNSGRCHYKTLIKVDSSPSQPWGLPGGWHGGPGGGSNPGVRASHGWCVSGLDIDNTSARSSNTWENIITVDGKAVDPSWCNTSSLTVMDSLRFGQTTSSQLISQPNSLCVDPTTKKLCFTDSQGTTHALY